MTVVSELAARVSVVWSALAVVALCGCAALWSGMFVSATAPPGGALAWLLLAAGVVLAVTVGRVAGRHPAAGLGVRWGLAASSAIVAGLLAIVLIVLLVVGSTLVDVFIGLLLVAAMVGLNAGAARLVNQSASPDGDGAVHDA